MSGGSGPRSVLRCRVDAGFTLIEMIVVMVLLGLVTTMALPAMQRWYDAVQARTQVMGVVETLRAAAFAAGANRHQLIVDAQSFSAAPASAASAASASPANAAPPRGEPDVSNVSPETTITGPLPVAAEQNHAQVTLPKGWQLDRIEPATFLANGLCSPGRVEFKTEAGARVHIEILGPTCSIGIADPNAATRR